MPTAISPLEYAESGDSGRVRDVAQPRYKLVFSNGPHEVLNVIFFPHSNSSCSSQEPSFRIIDTYRWNTISSPNPRASEMRPPLRRECMYFPRNFSKASIFPGRKENSAEKIFLGIISGNYFWKLFPDEENFSGNYVWCNFPEESILWEDGEIFVATSMQIEGTDEKYLTSTEYATNNSLINYLSFIFISLSNVIHFLR